LPKSSSFEQIGNKDGLEKAFTPTQGYRQYLEIIFNFVDYGKMKKRLKLEIGDIFCVKISNEKYKFFQFILCDKFQMESDVIQVFSTISDHCLFENLSDIIKSDIEFYVCTSCKVGFKQGYWEKIGNIPIENKLEIPPFISIEDVSPTITKSHNWRIRNVNEDYQFIGELPSDYKNLTQDGVWPAKYVVNKIETGKFGVPLEEVE